MRALLALAAAALALGQAAAPAPATITIVNPLDIARPAETMTLPAADLLKLVPVKDVREIHLRDARGTDILTQAIDLNDDGTFDELVFQADLGPRETRALSVVAGERRVPKKEEFRAYGRFVRERRDDFAWENDLVAHRMYGAALETWAQEPLTSSAIDVWVKKTPRLIINDWYLVDDYHRDTGEGADFYSAGTTRGCGGSGVWLNDRLYVSKNFRGTRVIANGPIRVMFDLTYEPWDVGASKVTETKRITLDAGHYLNRLESTYQGLPAAAAIGIGIRANPGAQVASDDTGGVLRVWEPIQNKPAANGWMGCAVVVDPAGWKGVRPQPVDGNHLAVASAANGHVVYFAGSAWDRAGKIRAAAAWEAYLVQAAARQRTPVRSTLAR
jgi:hypothetical protein